MTRYAAIWARVSTGHQDYDRQITACEEWADREDYRVVQVYADHHTATTDDGGNMWAYAQSEARKTVPVMHGPEWSIHDRGPERRAWDTIIVSQVSRLPGSRRRGGLAATWHALLQRGIAIRSASGNEAILNSDHPLAQDIIVAVLGIVTHMEHESRREAQRQGLARAREMWRDGVCPRCGARLPEHRLVCEQCGRLAHGVTRAQMRARLTGGQNSPPQEAR